MTRTMSLTIPSLIPKSQATEGAVAAAREDSEPDDDEFPAENVIDPDEELWARLHKLGAGQEPAPMDIPTWGTEQTTVRECQRLMAGHVATYPPSLVGFCCPCRSGRRKQLGLVQALFPHESAAGDGEAA
eukprot:jgi/Mesvir1/18990/Mv18951-RA.1